MNMNPSQSSQKTHFESHPFFKHLIGEWTGEVEDKAADGNMVKTKQNWKAAVLDDKTFAIEITDEKKGQARHIKWIYTCMDSGIFEAMCQPDINKANTQRHEAQVAENGSRIELTRLFENGSEVKVVYTFKDGGYDTLEVKLTLTDDCGTTLFKDSNVIKRKKP